MNPVSMNDVTLVDTSVWIDYLREESSTVGSFLSHRLEKNLVAINPVIRLELVSGARSQKQFDNLSGSLEGLWKIPIQQSIWQRAETLRYELTQDGEVIPVPDILIAATALEHNLSLCQRDDHFETIAEDTSLELLEIA